MIQITTNNKILNNYLIKYKIPVKMGNIYLSKVFLPELMTTKNRLQAIFNLFNKEDNNEIIYENIKNCISFMQKETEDDITIQFNCANLNSHKYNQIKSKFINKEDKKNYLYYTNNEVNVCNPKHKFIAIGLKSFQDPDNKFVKNLIKNCGIELTIGFILFHEFSHLIEEKNSKKNTNHFFQNFYNLIKNKSKTNNENENYYYLLYKESYADIYGLLLLKKYLIELNKFDNNEYSKIIKEIIKNRKLDHADHQTSTIIENLKMYDKTIKIDLLAEYLSIKNIYQNILKKESTSQEIMNKDFLIKEILNHFKKEIVPKKTVKKYKLT